MFKQFILAAVAALSPVTPISHAFETGTEVPSLFEDVGKNGAWRISNEKDGSRCMMSTKSIGSADYTLAILTYSSMTGVVIFGKDPLPASARAVITDKGNGEILMIKPLGRTDSDEDFVLGSDLSVQDLIRLWGATVMDDAAQEHLVTVHLGNVSFNVDIHGAQAAYQNIKSCAGR